MRLLLLVEALLPQQVPQRLGSLAGPVGGLQGPVQHLAAAAGGHHDPTAPGIPHAPPQAPQGFDWWVEQEVLGGVLAGTLLLQGLGGAGQGQRGIVGTQLRTGVP